MLSFKKCFDGTRQFLLVRFCLVFIRFFTVFLDPVTRAVLVPDVYRGFAIPAGTVVVANMWLVSLSCPSCFPIF